jgi:dephospho-CoA kinase
VTPWKVGLTGGLASGKSTVAGLLADAGFVVIDADRLVADLYRAGEPGAAAVAELFGPEMLDPEGAVRHDLLAERVFSDAEALRRLEAVIHPLVRERFARLVAENRDSTGPWVLEATRLVEAGYAPDFDTIVTVEAEPELRLQRALARGMAETAARARLAAQGDGAERLAAAHVVVDNNGDLAALRHQVDNLVAALRRP